MVIGLTEYFSMGSAPLIFMYMNNDNKDDNSATLPI